MQQRYYVPSFHFNTGKPCYCGSGLRFGLCCASHQRANGIPQSIAIIPNFVSEQERVSLLELAEKQPRNWLEVADAKPEEGKCERKIHSSRITERVLLQNKQQQLIESWFALACKEYLPSGAVSPLWFESPQLLRYDLGGKYGLHSDAENFCADARRFYRFIDRDFSMLIYLNDDYEGGGLNFKGLQFTYQPTAGDLVIFPSGHVFSHESLPITKGHKYALVTWGAFKGSPRVSRPRQTIMLH